MSVHRWISRPRLLPVLAACCLVLAVVKGEALWSGGGTGAARAARPPPEPPTASPLPVAAAAARPATVPPGPDPSPVESAEGAILTALRARRVEIEAREAALAAREAVMAAAERRLTGRLDELAAIQARLEAADRARAEREEGGWRGLVRTYETMRPRDAAAVFDDLEMPVLVGIVSRMREAKAAPILGAMRPERARPLTAELSRHRAAGEAPR